MPRTPARVLCNDHHNLWRSTSLLATADDDQHQLSNHHRNLQRRPTMPGDIEVIDVDLLDDDVGQRTLAGPSRAAASSSQRQPAISLVDDDSDDEIQVVGMRVPPMNRHSESFVSEQHGRPAD